MVASTLALRAIPRDTVSRLVTAKATRVSLQQMYTFGRHVLESKCQNAPVIPAQFLAEELPIRYTHVVRMLNSFNELPHISMSQIPSFRAATQRYLEDISTLTTFPKPDTPHKEGMFSELLRKLQQRHHQNMFSVGSSFQELFSLTQITPTDVDPEKTQRFFDQYYGLCLGTNLLMGEHLALHDEERSLVQKISPHSVAERAVADARRTCSQHFGRDAPEVEILTRDPEVTTVYVEEHLHRVLFELLKNSFRATFDFHGATSRWLPPVQLIIINGAEDISIRISDEGGGIPHSVTPEIWKYACNPSMEEEQGQQQYVVDDQRIQQHQVNHYLDIPLCGFGHGLPVARLIARYFGGELSLISMEGYGTDAYLALARDDTQPENYPDMQMTLGTDLLETPKTKSPHVNDLILNDDLASLERVSAPCILAM